MAQGPAEGNVVLHMLRQGHLSSPGDRPRLGHFPEHSNIDPRINRRCLRGLMTQQGADDFQRRAVAQQIRRRGMPEDMPRRQSLCLDAGPLDRSLRDRRHTTAGQGLMERRHHAQEHLLGIHDRPGMEDVILDRGADILWQRQDRGASRFAAEAKMNKNELVSHVAAETSATRATAERMVGAVFSAIGDALARGRARRHRRIRAVRHPRPCRAPGSQSANRGARRHRGLEGAVVQGGEGPSRRGQRIAWRAKRPPRSSRQRPRVRCAPSQCIRAETLGLENGSSPCACVKPIDEPALHASRGGLTPFTPRAVGPPTGPTRWAVGRLWQEGDAGISAFCRTRNHPRSPSRTTLVVRRRTHDSGGPREPWEDVRCYSLEAGALDVTNRDASRHSRQCYPRLLTRRIIGVPNSLTACRTSGPQSSQLRGQPDTSPTSRRRKLRQSSQTTHSPARGTNHSLLAGEFAHLVPQNYVTESPSAHLPTALSATPHLTTSLANVHPAPNHALRRFHESNTHPTTKNHSPFPISP